MRFSKSTTTWAICESSSVILKCVGHLSCTVIIWGTRAELSGSRGFSPATMSIIPGFFHKKRKNAINRTSQLFQILPTSIAYTKKLEIFVITLRYPHISKNKLIVVAKTYSYYFLSFVLLIFFQPGTYLSWRSWHVEGGWCWNELWRRSQVKQPWGTSVDYWVVPHFPQ